MQVITYRMTVGSLTFTHDDAAPKRRVSGKLPSLNLTVQVPSFVNTERVQRGEVLIFAGSLIEDLSPIAPAGQRAPAIAPAGSLTEQPSPEGPLPACGSQERSQLVDPVFPSLAELSEAEQNPELTE